MSEQKRKRKDRPWRDYPLGTRVHAYNGGYWERVADGWRWFGSAIFSQPGADAIGLCVALPE